MRVLVVAEFYPSDRDPVLGIWAHRQALAARDAGADVQVLVLNRVVPPRAAFRAGTAGRELIARLRQAPVTSRDGLTVAYVPFASPPRDRSYARWGAWAAPTLAVALRAVRARFRYDLVHAHNAVPAADAVLRARAAAPLVTSVHGGDVLFTARRVHGGAEAVRHGLAGSRLVLANTAGIAGLAEECGAVETRVVHLGADLPPPVHKRRDTIVTVGHLVARKRHADVVRALALLKDRHPGLRYVIVGDGPERAAIERLARELGVTVELTGQLPHEEALARTQDATLFAMPSVDEAFGVAYVEAMAAGVPAIGARGEPGPDEIGDGLVRVPPRDPEALAARIDGLLRDERHLAELRRAARRTVAERFTWERCGEATVAAYEEALRR